MRATVVVPCYNERDYIDNIVRGVLGPGRCAQVLEMLVIDGGSRDRKAAVGVAPLLPIPSFVESLPNKLLEYMAAGVPVVASDFPGWKDLVEGLEVGWCVPPGDPEALAERIGHALANPEDARARGRRGREAVENRFNWDVAFGEILRAYHLVMPRQPPGGA